MGNAARIRATQRHAARGDKRRKQGPPVLAIAAGVIVTALLAVFLLSRGGGALATGDVSITGGWLPRFDPNLATDPAIGTQAPTITGIGVDGEAVTIEPGQDRVPMIVAVVAHWCSHCNTDMAVLAPHLQAQPLEGVRLRTISTFVDSARENYPPSTWLKRMEWPGPAILDSVASEGADAFGASGTPFWVFLDADGRVVERWSGELGVDAFDARVQSLLT